MWKCQVQCKNLLFKAKTCHQMQKHIIKCEKCVMKCKNVLSNTFFLSNTSIRKKIIQGDNMLSNTQQELSNTKTSYLMWKCVIHCKKREIQRENVFLKILHLIFWRFLGFEIFKVQLFQFSGLNRKTGTIKVSGWPLKHILKVAGLLLQSCRKFQKFHCWEIAIKVHAHPCTVIL